jgi:hypothetical protein
MRDIGDRGALSKLGAVEIAGIAEGVVETKGKWHGFLAASGGIWMTM